MNDHEILAPIDDVLRQSLSPSLRQQFAGRIQQIYDPQARRPALMHYDDHSKPARFTVDTVHYDVQIAHRLTGGQPMRQPSQFGSRQKISFNLDWTMICASKHPDVMANLLLSFSRLQDVQVNAFRTDSLAVLKSEFLFVPDPSTPYDPLLQTFSIHYTMLSISENIFSLLLTRL